MKTKIHHGFSTPQISIYYTQNKFCEINNLPSQKQNRWYESNPLKIWTQIKV